MALLARPRLAAAARWLVTALVAIPVLVHAGAYAVEAGAWRLGRGAGEVRAHCGRCHDPERARDFARSPAAWERTVDGMLVRRGPGGAAPAEDREALAGWLVRHRSADGAELYRHRCGRCHRRSALEPYRALGDPTLAELVRQHTRQQNHAVQVWEGEAILGHLLPTGEVPAFDPAVSVEFQQACGACHSSSFLYRTMCRPAREVAEWEALVTRMGGKSPELFAADRIVPLARQSVAVCDPPFADR